MSHIANLIRRFADSIEDLPTFFFKVRNRRMVSFNLCKSLRRFASSPVGREVGTVLDVGANCGQFTMMARYCWPKARVYSFEPDPVAARQCRLIHSPDPLVSVEDCALGEFEGLMKLRIAKNSVQNSFLVDPDVEVQEMTEVPVHRLDAIITRPLIKQVLLKIDVHGFEASVLKGASALLDEIDWIILEVSLVDHFEGGARIDDIWRQMQSYGFRYEAILDQFVSPVSGIVSEMDILFAKVKIPKR
jgi:FkbM family methyltransferase